MLSLPVALLGLFPAIFLTALQLMLLVMVVWLLRYAGRVRALRLRDQIDWTHVALWQFFSFFLINALVFKPLPGTPDHFRSVAIETWAVSLLASVVIALYLALHRPVDVKIALIKWLPVGLCLTFAIATVVYLSGVQGERIQIATPNPLVPPLWYLILTMASFAWFDHLTRVQKVLRAGLFVMAGLMALYAGARLIMLAWLLSGMLMAVYLIILAPAHRRKNVLWSSLLAMLVSVFVLGAVDTLSGGFVSFRFGVLLEGGLSYEEMRDRSARLVLWEAGLKVAIEHLPFGVGAINERVLVREEIGWDLWRRTHQTYLSFLIAGGPLALISGLLLQAPVLQFLRRDVVRDMFPVFIGLGVVLTLNCLTDSVLQSGVGVQVYMVILLLYHRAQSASGMSDQA